MNLMPAEGARLADQVRGFRFSRGVDVTKARQRALQTLLRGRRHAAKPAGVNAEPADDTEPERAAGEAVAPQRRDLIRALAADQGLPLRAAAGGGDAGHHECGGGECDGSAHEGPSPALRGVRTRAATVAQSGRPERCRYGVGADPRSY